MFEPLDLSVTALAFPLLAAIAAVVLGAMRLGRLAHLPTIAAFGASAILALIALVKVAAVNGDRVSFTNAADTWFQAGHFSITFSITLDPLSAIMLATVTFVATWIAVFSSGYMRDSHGKPDAGYARYFALMSFFVFAMCLLVLSNNFLLLLAGWEGVGLCSYLLVGYYYAKPSAAAAARKAFLVTRLGDVGMILGIFYLWQIGGFNTNLYELFDYIAKHPETHSHMTVACLLLFCGAVGKSAQLPLYVWLPDAMEGPTPVSALIHAATMVTAGVYLLARCALLFTLAPDAQIIVSVVGGLTALLAALIAVTQTDLKRVLAYSTVSQLGFMFMALGCGGQVAPNLAVAAAIFHLFTHAFFKALLFLGSGSVMHAMGNVIDMRRFGGLRKLMPVTNLTFLLGSAALAGLPLLSGFWSKDAILDSLFETAGATGPYRSWYWCVFGIALFTAFLTAFYTFRAYCLTFWGEFKIPPEAGDHAHESPRTLLVPLIVLAVGAVAAGILVEPFTHGFSGFLAKTPSLMLANDVAPVTQLGTHTPHPHFNWTVAGVSSVIAIVGAALAWRLYKNASEDRIPAALAGIHRFSREKFYIDELYAALIIKPIEGFADFTRKFDHFLAAMTRLVAFVPRLAGSGFKPLQNGQVQFYALSMVLGLAVFITVIVFRSVR